MAGCLPAPAVRNTVHLHYRQTQATTAVVAHGSNLYDQSTRDHKRQGGQVMTDDPPRPTPEGQMIRRVRSLSIPKLTIPAAAARIGLSAEQWGYVERGYYPARDGNPPRPFSPPAATLAKMAHALRITPERLETEGQRPDAAEILAEILRQQHEAEPSAADRDWRPEP